MAKLTEAERRYLSRHVCAWCEMPLHRDDCAAFESPCSPETREKRRADCLGARIAQMPRTRRSILEDRGNG